MTCYQEITCPSVATISTEDRTKRKLHPEIPLPKSELSNQDVHADDSLSSLSSGHQRVGGGDGNQWERHS